MGGSHIVHDLHSRLLIEQSKLRSHLYTEEEKLEISKLCGELRKEYRYHNNRKAWVKANAK